MSNAMSIGVEQHGNMEANRGMLKITLTNGLVLNALAFNANNAFGRKFAILGKRQRDLRKGIAGAHLQLFETESDVPVFGLAKHQRCHAKKLRRLIKKHPIIGKLAGKMIFSNLIGGFSKRDPKVVKRQKQKARKFRNDLRRIEAAANIAPKNFQQVHTNKNYETGFWEVEGEIPQTVWDDRKNWIPSVFKAIDLCSDGPGGQIGATDCEPVEPPKYKLTDVKKGKQAFECDLFGGTKKRASIDDKKDGDKKKRRPNDQSSTSSDSDVEPLAAMGPKKTPVLKEKSATPTAELNVSVKEPVVVPILKYKKRGRPSKEDKAAAIAEALASNSSFNESDLTQETQQEVPHEIEPVEVPIPIEQKPASPIVDLLLPAVVPTVVFAIPKKKRGRPRKADKAAALAAARALNSSLNDSDLAEESQISQQDETVDVNVPVEEESVPPVVELIASEDDSHPEQLPKEPRYRTPKQKEKRGRKSNESKAADESISSINESGLTQETQQEVPHEIEAVEMPTVVEIKPASSIAELIAPAVVPTVVFAKPRKKKRGRPSKADKAAELAALSSDSNLNDSTQPPSSAIPSSVPATSESNSETPATKKSNRGRPTKKSRGPGRPIGSLNKEPVFMAESEPEPERMKREESQIIFSSDEDELEKINEPADEDSIDPYVTELEALRDKCIDCYVFDKELRFYLKDLPRLNSTNNVHNSCIMFSAMRLIEELPLALGLLHLDYFDKFWTHEGPVVNLDPNEFVVCWPKNRMCQFFIVPMYINRHFLFSVIEHRPDAQDIVYFCDSRFQRANAERRQENELEFDAAIKQVYNRAFLARLGLEDTGRDYLLHNISKESCPQNYGSQCGPIVYMNLRRFFQATESMVDRDELVSMKRSRFTELEIRNFFVCYLDFWSERIKAFNANDEETHLADDADDEHSEVADDEAADETLPEEEPADVLPTRFAKYGITKQTPDVADLLAAGELSSIESDDGSWQEDEPIDEMLAEHIDEVDETDLMETEPMMEDLNEVEEMPDEEMVVTAENVVETEPIVEQMEVDEQSNQAPVEEQIITAKGLLGHKAAYYRLDEDLTFSSMQIPFINSTTPIDLRCITFALLKFVRDSKAKIGLLDVEFFAQQFAPGNREPKNHMLFWQKGTKTLIIPIVREHRVAFALAEFIPKPGQKGQGKAKVYFCDSTLANLFPEEMEEAVEGYISNLEQIVCAVFLMDDCFTEIVEFINVSQESERQHDMCNGWPFVYTNVLNYFRNAMSGQTLAVDTRSANERRTVFVTVLCSLFQGVSPRELPIGFPDPAAFVVDYQNVVDDEPILGFSGTTILTARDLFRGRLEEFVSPTVSNTAMLQVAAESSLLNDFLKKNLWLETQHLMCSLVHLIASREEKVGLVNLLFFSAIPYANYYVNRVLDALITRREINKKILVPIYNGVNHYTLAVFDFDGEIVTISYCDSLGKTPTERITARLLELVDNIYTPDTPYLWKYASSYDYQVLPGEHKTLYDTINCCAFVYYNAEDHLSLNDFVSHGITGWYKRYGLYVIFAKLFNVTPISTEQFKQRMGVSTYLFDTNIRLRHRPNMPTFPINRRPHIDMPPTAAPIASVVPVVPATPIARVVPVVSATSKAPTVELYVNVSPLTTLSDLPETAGEASELLGLLPTRFFFDRQFVQLCNPQITKIAAADLQMTVYDLQTFVSQNTPLGSSLLMCSLISLIARREEEIGLVSVGFFDHEIYNHHYSGGRVKDALIMKPEFINKILVPIKNEEGHFMMAIFVFDGKTVTINFCDSYEQPIQEDIAGKLVELVNAVYSPDTPIVWNQPLSYDEQNKETDKYNSAAYALYNANSWVNHGRFVRSGRNGWSKRFELFVKFATLFRWEPLSREDFKVLHDFGSFTFPVFPKVQPAFLLPPPRIASAVSTMPTKAKPTRRVTFAEPSNDISVGDVLGERVGNYAKTQDLKLTLRELGDLGNWEFGRANWKCLLFGLLHFAATTKHAIGLFDPNFFGDCSKIRDKSGVDPNPADYVLYWTPETRFFIIPVVQKLNSDFAIAVLLNKETNKGDGATVTEQEIVVFYCDSPIGTDLHDKPVQSLGRVLRESLIGVVSGVFNAQYGFGPEVPIHVEDISDQAGFQWQLNSGTSHAYTNILNFFTTLSTDADRVLASDERNDFQRREALLQDLRSLFPGTVKPAIVPSAKRRAVLPPKGPVPKRSTPTPPAKAKAPKPRKGPFDSSSDSDDAPVSTYRMLNTGEEDAAEIDDTIHGFDEDMFDIFPQLPDPDMIVMDEVEDDEAADPYLARGVVEDWSRTYVSQPTDYVSPPSTLVRPPDDPNLRKTRSGRIYKDLTTGPEIPKAAPIPGRARGRPSLAYAASKKNGVTPRPFDVGTMGARVCPHCQAFRFPNENLEKCCKNGFVRCLPLPRYAPFHQKLCYQTAFNRSTLTEEERGMATFYQQNTVGINNNIAFGTTSVSTKGSGVRGPPVQLMNGHIDYNLCYLEGVPGNPLKFAQLYTTSTSKEAMNHLKQSPFYRRLNSKYKLTILRMFIKFMMKNNSIAKGCKMAYERIQEMRASGQKFPHYIVNFLDSSTVPAHLIKRKVYRTQGCKPRVPEVAVMFQERGPGVNAPNMAAGIFLVQRRGKKPMVHLKRQPAVNAYAFPLMFPRGEMIFSWNCKLRTPDEKIKEKVHDVFATATDAELDFYVYGAEQDPALMEENENVDGITTKKKVRVNASIREQFNYRAQHRLSDNDINVIWNNCALGQRFVIKTYFEVIDNEVSYYHDKVEKRMVSAKHIFERYEELLKKQMPGKTLGSVRRFPKQHVDSWEYQQRAYAKGLAIAQKHGSPTFMLTVTANPMWPEFVNACELTGLRPENAGHLLVRVFCLKLKLLMHQCTGPNTNGVGILGKVNAYCMSHEFQKRGGIHAHILFWIDKADTELNAEFVDDYCTAEIPDYRVDPEGYRAVIRHMLHTCNRHSVCRDKKNPSLCLRRYPQKEFQDTTIGGGFVRYRRKSIAHGSVVVQDDNHLTWTDKNCVPYNRYILLAWNGHANLEAVVTNGTPGYTIKYILKGGDVIFAEVLKMKLQDDAEVDENGEPKEPTPNRFVKEINGEMHIDEHSYVSEMRYIGVQEAYTKLMSIKPFIFSHTVVWLSLHLEKDFSMVIGDNEKPQEIHRRAKKKIASGVYSQLTAFFAYCREHPEETKDYTYIEFNEKYIYKKKTLSYELPDPPRRLKRVVAVYHVPVKDRQKLALRTILLFKKSPKSFEDCATVNDIFYQRDVYNPEDSAAPPKKEMDFMEAAKHMGLLESDLLWRRALDQRIHHTVRKMIFMFAQVLIEGGTSICDPPKLWIDYRQYMIPPLGHKQKFQDKTNEELLLIGEQIALSILDSHLECVQKTRLNWELPRKFTAQECEALGVEFRPYDPSDHGEQAVSYLEGDFEPVEHTKIDAVDLEGDQLAAFTEIRDAISSDPEPELLFKPDMFFLHGSAGTGKSVLCNQLLRWCIEEKIPFSSTATTGIAASLLYEGQTLHSRFFIPNKCATRDPQIQMDSDPAKRLRALRLLIIDEASQLGKDPFWFLMRTLAAVRKGSEVDHRLIIVFTGDFRQILPIVPRNGSSYQASLMTEEENIKFLSLMTNRRTDADQQEFRDYTADIGVGRNPYSRIDWETTKYKLMNEVHQVFSDDELIEATFPADRPEEWTQSAITTPLNVTVNYINNKVLDRMVGEGQELKVYDAINTPDPETINSMDASAIDANTEAMAALDATGIGQQRLRLKVGAKVMLIKNIDVRYRLCNGTPAIITALGDDMICLDRINHDGSRGEEVSIVRARFVHDVDPDNGRTLRFTRIQFPIRLAFAMTFNKVQGQTLKKCALHLVSQPFASGHLFVAMTRVRRASDLIVYNPNPEGPKKRVDLVTNVVDPQAADFVTKLEQRGRGVYPHEVTADMLADRGTNNGLRLNDNDEMEYTEDPTQHSGDEQEEHMIRHDGGTLDGLAFPTDLDMYSGNHSPPKAARDFADLEGYNQQEIEKMIRDGMRAALATVPSGPTVIPPPSADFYDMLAGGFANRGQPSTYRTSTPQPPAEPESYTSPVPPATPPPVVAESSPSVVRPLTPLPHHEAYADLLTGFGYVGLDSSGVDDTTMELEYSDVEPDTDADSGTDEDIADTDAEKDSDAEHKDKDEDKP